jgi:hypothetical protein
MYLGWVCTGMYGGEKVYVNVYGGGGGRGV